MAGSLLFARGFGIDGVPLHTERRGLKRVGAAAVMKRVEHDLDLIVVVNIFAARHACAHLLGVIEADKDDVEIFLVVAQVKSLRRLDRKSTRLNSSHQIISYAVFCLK